jgi:hypothetical protein
MTFDRDRVVAAIDMIGRMGGKFFEIRYCDGHDDDPLEPVVWIARARWESKGRYIWQATGACDPWRAIFRLLEVTLDGGTCTHCGKPTGVDESPPSDMLIATESMICWYRFDPELATFRRSCEGVAA